MVKMLSGGEGRMRDELSEGCRSTLTITGEYDQTSSDGSSPQPYYSTPSSSSGVGSGSGSSSYGCSSTISNGGLLNNCSSTDNLNEAEEHIYEDIAIDTPRRLPKITALLNKDKTAVVRPVAFKPTHSSYPTPNRTATPISVPMRKCETPSDVAKSTFGMSHTGSLKLSLLRSSQFSLSQNSLCLDNCDNQSSMMDSCIKTPSSFVSSPSSKMMSGSYLHLDDFSNRQMQTPSPSDSGIAELEAMLKEKDSEINYLRETLEQNEQVIFKVFEEKQHNWKKELGRIRAQYDNRLKMCQQRALKMEQLLMNQSYQLQQEKKKQSVAYERIKREKEASAKQRSEIKKELESLNSQLEETRWSVCQKNGEISLMKTQLKESRHEQSLKATEFIGMKSRLKEAKQDSDEKSARIVNLEAEMSRLRKEAEDSKLRLEHCLRDLKMTSHERINRNSTVLEVQLENDKLRSQLMEAKRAIDYERGTQENERINWLEEKEKVIRYQKQLQLNYVQMFRRNHNLERELEQLTLQLDQKEYRTLGESNC